MILNQIINILNEEDSNKELYFCEKNKEKYNSVCPEVSNEIFDIIIKNAIEYLKERSEDELIDFNPTGYREGTLEFCDIDYVGNYEEVINTFDPSNIEIENEDISKFTFYCINIKSNGQELKLFRKLTKFKKLSTKGFLGAFQGNRLNRIDSKILGIDGEIDLIVYNNKIYILNHISLERIFEIKIQYEQKSKETLEALKSSGKIQNFDAFEYDCLSNMTTRKILTKMQNEDNDLNKCFDNFENVIDTIELFELPIEININNQTIIYESKDQIKDILQLARDSYYRSLVQGKPGIDNKV